MVFGLVHFFTGSITAQEQTVDLEIRAKAGLQFSVVRFAAKPGQSVHLNVFNDDEMAHNLVFTKVGQRVAVANAALVSGLSINNRSSNDKAREEDLRIEKKE